MTADVRIQRLLMSALNALKQGNLEHAKTASFAVLEIDSTNPDALQFLGLINKNQGNLKAAEDYMRRSLQARPAQPHVLNNLGNLLDNKGEPRKAVEEFKKAVALVPNYSDAWFNLASVLFDLNELEEAKVAAEKAKKTWPQESPPKPHTLLGNIYRCQKNYEQALKSFKEALSVDPNYFIARHNYGAILKMMQRHEEALKVYLQAKSLKPDVPELYFNIADTYFALGKIDSCLENYYKAIELKPDYIEAHNDLNEILWMFNRTEEYLDSYRKAISQVPKAKELRYHYIDALIIQGSINEAETAIADIFKTCGPDAKAFQLYAKVECLKGNINNALKGFEKCIELDPNAGEFRLDLVKHLILMNNYENALSCVEEVLIAKPLDQEALAYQGLCWRLLGDKREEILNDYDTFVRGYYIETPPGYKNITDFNQALNKALDPFHNAQTHPSTQTLRGGTQSMVSLFDCEIKEIQELKKSLEKTIQQYILDLPDDPNHPFLGRKSDSFEFSGSWTVRLKSQGYHVNHYHPKGWISSSYYVALPNEVKEGQNKQGWIKFGESPLNLGGKDVARKTIQPQEGLLVLFPSYFFHGTIPFSSEQPRTTLPSDIVPLFA